MANAASRTDGGWRTRPLIPTSFQEPPALCGCSYQRGGYPERRLPVAAALRPPLEAVGLQGGAAHD